MDLSHLRFFVTLAEALHYSRAAEICHVSSSTLTRSIQHLESELDTRLFERDNRSVVITQEGMKLLRFARETLQQWEALRDAIQSESNQLRGSLSLYCSVTASYSFLYDILADFRQQHPFIEIKLHTGDPALAVDRVLAGHEDLAIAARQNPLSQDLDFRRITFSPLKLIQPLQDRWFETKLADTRSYWQTVPFIMSERGVARERLNEWFRKRQITPNIYAQVAGHEAIVSMVSLGFGVGLVPQIVLDNSPLAAKVKPHPFQPQLKPYEVGLCVLKRRLKNAVVSAFWQQLGEPGPG